MRCQSGRIDIYRRGIERQVGDCTAAAEERVPALAAIERPILRLAGVDPDEEQTWLGYALALRRIPSLLEPPEPDPGIVCY